MNRMKKILISVFITAAFCIPSEADVLEFAQAGDVKYNYLDSISDKYMRFFKLSLSKTKPDFTVLLGNNQDKSEEMSVIRLMQKLYTLKMPYYLVLGSNDTNGTSGIDKETYLEIVSAFNKKQKKNYYYFKPDKSFICAVLDDTSDFASSKHGEISDEQLEWLDKLLSKYPKKLFIIFQHSPVNPPRLEYELSMINEQKYRSIIDKHSNIAVISSGKYRQADVKQDEAGITHISAPSFSENHAYQLIKITYDKKKLNRSNIKIDVLQTDV